MIKYECAPLIWKYVIQNIRNMSFYSFNLQNMSYILLWTIICVRNDHRIWDFSCIIQPCVRIQSMQIKLWHACFTSLWRQSAVQFRTRARTSEKLLAGSVLLFTMPPLSLPRMAAFMQLKHIHTAAFTFSTGWSWWADSDRQILMCTIQRMSMPISYMPL